MEIPVYPLESIMGMHEGHIAIFLSTLGIPATNDPQGQIALALNRLRKLQGLTPYDSINLVNGIEATNPENIALTRRMIETSGQTPASDRWTLMTQLAHAKILPSLIDNPALSLTTEDFRRYFKGSISDPDYTQPGLQEQLRSIAGSDKPYAFIYGEFSVDDIKATIRVGLRGVEKETRKLRSELALHGETGMKQPTAPHLARFEANRQRLSELSTLVEGLDSWVRFVSVISLEFSGTLAGDIDTRLPEHVKEQLFRIPQGVEIAQMVKSPDYFKSALGFDWEISGTSETEILEEIKSGHLVDVHTANIYILNSLSQLLYGHDAFLGTTRGTNLRFRAIPLDTIHEVMLPTLKEDVFVI